MGSSKIYKSKYGSFIYTNEKLGWSSQEGLMLYPLLMAK
jgi:hypothetical protein